MTQRWKRGACAALVGAALMTTSALASANDVGVGVGVSYVFGGGIAVGFKAFSNDEDNEAVGSVGLDYLFESGAFRPNIGVAYQGEGYFTGGDVGYNFGTQSIDFGLGGGWSNGDDHQKKSQPAPAPAPIFI